MALPFHAASETLRRSRRTFCGLASTNIERGATEGAAVANLLNRCQGRSEFSPRQAMRNRFSLSCTSAIPTPDASTDLTWPTRRRNGWRHRGNGVFQMGFLCLDDVVSGCARSARVHGPPSCLQVMVFMVRSSCPTVHRLRGARLTSGMRIGA